MSSVLNRYQRLGQGLGQPVAPNASGRMSLVSGPEKVRQAIYTLLDTDPGERVMRPDFGSGLMQLVFAPNSSELAATTQFLVQGALQQWLGSLIALEAVEVEAVEAMLRVTVRYVILRSGASQVASFERGGAPA